eukprot:TRINITY_DN20949_c0_g1_i1.p1 TRINITY_DN20949_c0_g1~~TRINITY_DN20949_c0_g1_i1.p1  ORF type:complete len:375 (+),score=71.90 TRINITY_DN20949_c0_g1_i1:175-1299(+)
MQAIDLLRHVHGFVYALPAAFLAWVYCIFVFPPLAVLLIFKPTRWYYHYIKEKIIGFWMHFAALSLEWFAMTTISITFDDKTELARESALLISNHPTHLDWHPIFCLLARCGKTSTLRIILKDQLRKLPIAGWAWQLAMYIFLTRRDKERDVSWLKQCLKHWKQSGMQGSWLIFPDGTDMSKSNVEKSQAFARERGWPVYHNVLHPRTAGFVSMLQQGRDKLDAVYDITMAFQYFAKDERPREASYLKGRFPPVVHMHVKRYPIQDLPVSDEDLTAWCRERWGEKEEMLGEAYSSLEDKHLPLKLPGKPSSNSLELWVKVKYLVALLGNAWFGFMALGWLSHWQCMVYAVIMSIVWHYLAIKVGIDRLLYNLEI